MIVIPNRVRLVAVLSALALAGGLLTLTLLAKPTQAQGNGATTEEFQIAFTHDATACTGEIIDVKGTMHFTNHYMAKEDGTVYVNSHLLFRARGVGLDPATGEPTGNEYVFRTKDLGFEYYVEPGQYLSRYITTTAIVAKGSIPNQQFFQEYIFIINPDGTLKMEHASFHNQCQQ